MKLRENDKSKSTSKSQNISKNKVISIDPYIAKNRFLFKIDFSILKKGLLILGLAFLLHNSLCETEDITSEVSINIESDDFAYFAEYSLGRVYICQNEDKYFYQQLLRENDILVVDKRSGEDPDMCIYNSCMISDTKTIREVLLILKEYERRYPSEWNRTLSSMYNEWLIHNICYKFNYRTLSTKHVDLDNEDEEFYSSAIFKLLLSR